MISVCMATFNGEKYLIDQLDSIIGNITSSDEIIVSDDGSTDGTAAILLDYARNDHRIKITEGPRKGVNANFSHAISLAQGDIIFLADQDDLWREDKVSIVLTAFQSTGCDLVVHNAQLIDGDGKALDETLFDIRHSRSGYIKNIARNSYVGCCMAFRRELVSVILPIPENVEMHDWWIGLIAEKLFRSTFIKDKLIGYRRHSENVSSMHHYGIGKMISNRLTLIQETNKRILTLKKVAK